MGLLRGAVFHVMAREPKSSQLSSQLKCQPAHTHTLSQSFSWNSPREHGRDHPNPTIQGILRLQSIFRILSPQYGWGRLFFFRSVAIQRFCYRGPKPQKCPKWLGGSFGPRAPKSSSTGAKGKRVAPVQNRVLVVQKTLGRPLPPGSKTPFAPSPNHFGHF